MKVRIFSRSGGERHYLKGGRRSGPYFFGLGSSTATEFSSWSAAEAWLTTRKLSLDAFELERAE